MSRLLYGIRVMRRSPKQSFVTQVVVCYPGNHGGTTRNNLFIPVVVGYPGSQAVGGSHLPRENDKRAAPED